MNQFADPIALARMRRQNAQLPPQMENSMPLDLPLPPMIPTQGPPPMSAWNTPATSNQRALDAWQLARSRQVQRPSMQRREAQDPLMRNPSRRGY